MSLSKEQPAVPAAQPRQTKCARCRHHGIVVPQKGHMKQCPFLECDCWKCYLITQRTRISALQRNLKKTQSKSSDREQRPREPAVEPVAHGPSSVMVPDGGARSPGTSDLICPHSAGSPGWSPLDLRSRSAVAGDYVAAPESRDVLPITPNGFYFNEIGHPPPLPLWQRWRMSAHYPHFQFMPWLQAVPAALDSNSLYGPRILPHFQQGSVLYPPPPEPVPPADSRHVYFTLQPHQLPEAFQEELKSRQHPQPPQPPLPKLSMSHTEELNTL